MSKVYILGDDQGLFNAENCAKAVTKVLHQRSSYSFEVIVVSEQEIQSINKEQRGVDGVTDVLSFPTLDGIRNRAVTKKDFPYDIEPETDSVFMGSIIICEKRAKEQAKEYGHSETREFSYLFVHGLMHLFGYDHMVEGDKAEMRTFEDKVMAELRILR